MTDSSPTISVDVVVGGVVVVVAGVAVIVAVVLVAVVLVVVAVLVVAYLTENVFISERADRVESG